MEKTLNVTDMARAKAQIVDFEVTGNGDLFRVLCKASSQQQGWMKSTKAMAIPKLGCVVQVTTQQRGMDGTYAVAEAVTFVPGVEIVDDINGGAKLQVFVG